MPLLAQLLLVLQLVVVTVVAIRIVPKSELGNNINVPFNGPCLLNNEYAFKCTAAGYYETVQCDDTGCFCVDAHNGAAAQATRTGSNKAAPVCSECHNYLKNMYANGEPPKNSYIPRCDRDFGDFEKLQCSGDSCFCVDPSSGKEIPGTKKKREKNFILRCDEKGVVATSAKAREDGQVLPVGRDYCRLDRDRGTPCNTKPSRIMFYFDSNTFTCLSFEHKGCGGNDNRFYSKADCQSTCVLADFFSCSGLSPAAKNAKGHGIVCGGMMPDAPRGMGGVSTDGCPAGYKCVMGGFFGFCCDAANEDRYAKAYRPVCARGAAYKTKNARGRDQVVLGKTCSDNFCPSGYSCKEGDIYAFCCP